MMKIISRTIITAIILVCIILPVTVFSFDIYDKRANESYFLVDYTAFNDGDQTGKIKLELYYQIYNTILNFQEKNDIYEAEYELAIKIFDDHEMLVDSYKQDKTVKVPSEKKTESRLDYRINLVDFYLDPGKYKAKFILSDPNSNDVVEREIKINLKKYDKKKPQLSDLQLIQAVTKTGEESSVFDKGNLTLIPSVSHTFGYDDKMRLLFYMEIYQGSEIQEDVRVETVLRHDRKGMVYRDSLTTNFEGDIIKQFREISLEEFVPGKYELIVTLKGNRDKKFSIRYRDFELVWSQNSMLKYDFKSIINQLSIVADKKEIDELEKYETYEDRLRAFNAFWLARDPSPGTKENEQKTEFYRRVLVANRNFSNLYKTGWKTDRGRIYIMFGEPDQVDDYPVVANSRPYQEWHYYKGSRYRKFIFVDVNEDGDYELQYPYDGLYQRPDF